MSPAARGGRVLGHLLGDLAVLATAVALWELVGVLGVLGYWVFRVVVGVVRAGAR